jgi:hypothetical protein
MREKRFNGMFFGEGTPDEVCEVLSNLVRPRKRIRLWYGEDGRSWNEQYDITGYVGKTGGNIPITILVNKNCSYGGPAILTNCIVKIVEIKTKKVLYQHPNFYQPIFTVVTHDADEYQSVVLADGILFSRHRTEKQAKRFADFMNGKRHNL